MSKKRTMQIDVIEEVKGTQFMQCKLYIDGNASVILKIGRASCRERV